MQVSFNQTFPDLDREIDQKLSKRFRDQWGMDRIYLTTSCSSALEMAAEILEVGPGDEVILPSFTYVTTAMAFEKKGASLIFVDIDPETFVMDLDDVESKITDRTKVIVAVHYAGISPDMNRLKALAGERIAIVEDAAQGLDAYFEDQALGTMGAIGVISFHHTKNISTGEGGMLILNDPSLEPKADIVFEKGTDRQAFINGEVDSYSWVDIGGSYEMSDYLKMRLLGELEKLESIRLERRRVYERYLKGLEDSGLDLQRVPEGCLGNHHIFALLTESGDRRARIIEEMKRRGIQTTFHYQPLHLSKYGRSRGYDRFTLPATELVAERLLRLPIYPALDNATIDRITGHLKNILEEIR